MTLPNGSIIAVTGIDVDEKEMNKLLGRKFRLVCIDEASMYTIDLRNLVYGVLGPAMVDPNDQDESGTICLMGTASDFPRGLFFDITQGLEKGWDLFKWTANDNPYVAKKWLEALEKIRLERPSYMETPQYKQWYLNQWVVDEEKLVYRFDTQKNLTKGIPLLSVDGWTYVLGVDTGWEDDSAFVLTGYHVNNPYLYVLKSFKKKKMTFDDVVLKIQEFMADKSCAPHKIIIDGANKQGVESMKQRSAIPFEYADKQDKATFIELCNSDLIQGKIKMLEMGDNHFLWEEMASLVWMTDGDKIKYPKKEHPTLSNHLCFVAGTKILIPDGEANIEDLKVGDLVLTETGIHPIKATISSTAETIKLVLNTGESMITTPNHPFKVGDAWIPAKDLLHKSLTARNTSYRQRKDTSNELSIQKSKFNTYTERFGSIITALYQKISTFIIKMKISPIMTLAISNAYLEASTTENIIRKNLNINMDRKTWNIWLKSESLQRPGTLRQKAGPGTKSIMPSKSISQVVEAGLNKVYNISVAIDPTYYADNILVSNCDAFLYSWRCGWHYASVPQERKLVVGSREWYLQQSDNIWEKERERLEKEEKGDWPSEGNLGELG